MSSDDPDMSNAESGGHSYEKQGCITFPRVSTSVSLDIDLDAHLAWGILGDFKAGWQCQEVPLDLFLGTSSEYFIPEESVPDDLVSPLFHLTTSLDGCVRNVKLGYKSDNFDQKIQYTEKLLSMNDQQYKYVYTRKEVIENRNMRFLRDQNNADKVYGYIPPVVLDSIPDELQQQQQDQEELQLKKPFVRKMRNTVLPAHIQRMLSVLEDEQQTDEAAFLSKVQNLTLNKDIVTCLDFVGIFEVIPTNFQTCKVVLKASAVPVLGEQYKKANQGLPDGDHKGPQISKQQEEQYRALIWSRLHSSLSLQSVYVQNAVRLIKATQSKQQSIFQTPAPVSTKIDEDKKQGTLHAFLSKTLQAWDVNVGLKGRNIHSKLQQPTSKVQENSELYHIMEQVAPILLDGLVHVVQEYMKHQKKLEVFEIQKKTRPLLVSPAPFIPVQSFARYIMRNNPKYTTKDEEKNTDNTNTEEKKHKISQAAQMLLQVIQHMK